MIRLQTRCISTVLIIVFAVGPVDATSAQLSDAAGLARNAIQHLRDEEPEQALTLFGTALTTATPADDGVMAAAAGGIARVLSQLDTDEQYELLHDWSMPNGDRKDVRVFTTIVPEISPPAEFARALGQRPRKDSFAVSSVGSMLGIFCSAWTMVVAADDAGTLRQLVTELDALAKNRVPNASFVLTLAKLRDRRSEIPELQKLLEARDAGGDGVPAPADRSDAVLVAAGLERQELGTVCESIVERLCKHDFQNGTSTFVPFLRRLRATVILKNRSPETRPRDLFSETPDLWVAADDQSVAGRATGGDFGSWLTHEDHVKRLCGPGDDLLLLKYPLTGTFELKGEVAELDHGGGGMTYGGLAFDANAKGFTLVEAQRGHSVNRVWPFVAPQEHRMFNRVNLRSDGEKVVFLSNLHPGWTGTVQACNSSPWLGLRAFGHGRIIFRNLELVGEPTIPREVHLISTTDLRGWTSGFGEATPKFVKPFPTKTEDVVATAPVWKSTDGVIHGAAVESPDSDGVVQSHLAYIRPLLDDETVTYDFYYEEQKVTAHPALGRLAFLMEPGGIRLHWLTNNTAEWTGLEPDNAVIEPLNRRGPPDLPLKSGEWNTVSLKLANDTLMITLNSDAVYERPLDDLTGRNFGLYHDRNASTVQVRNIVLTGNWPEKLSAEQLENLIAVGE